MLPRQSDGDSSALQPLTHTADVVHMGSRPIACFEADKEGMPDYVTPLCVFLCVCVYMLLWVPSLW